MSQRVVGRSAVDWGELQRIAAELAAGVFQVPPDVRVSCPFGCDGGCVSASRRRRGWVCGSDFCHDDRMGCCVSYRRLQRGMHDGVSGNWRFQK